MHWLARVFVSAIVRRIVVVIVVLLLGWVGAVRAQDTCYTNAESGSCPNEGAANSAAMAAAQAYTSNPAYNRTACPPVPNKKGATWSVWVYVTPTHAPRCDGSASSPSFVRYYSPARSCEKEPAYTGVGPWSSGGSAKNGSLGCRNGCDGMWSKNGDGAMSWKATGDVCPRNEKDNCERIGEGYFYNSLLKVCEPPEGKCQDGRKPNSLGQCAPEPCPSGMLQQADGTCKNKDNECPAGQIKSPAGNCLPGDGQCAQGEVRGKDGTCKKDSDGDGQPDEGEEGGEGPDGKKKDEFSGGDDCKTPPTCSGSPIMCGQARIQWRIDCNTRKNRNIAGGACNTPPVCTGEKCDALEYSGLLMQWRTACALEKLNTGNGGSADTAAIRDALTGNAGTPDIGAEGNPSGAFSDESGYGAGGYPGKFTPDTSGFGYSRTCPSIPPVSIMGQTINFDTSVFCSWLVLGGQFVLIIAALVSLRIISSGGSQ